MDGERKTVTALFADIKGSMELMEDLDPEEARTIVDPALQLMIDVVHRYDGHIVQSTGDGIFALFGAPVAHEDHPLRALYAALRMQEDMRHYAERLRGDKGINLQARVGINTGEVVVRSIQTGDSFAPSPITPLPQGERGTGLHSYFQSGSSGCFRSHSGRRLRTVGICSKLYGGGGDVVDHSNVQAFHGSSPAGWP